jgi:hypothetical protein
VALGFAEITEHGRAGNAEFRSPHKFRLTYFRVGRAPPTNEWQRIKTVEEAQLARAARREAPQKTKVRWRKTPNLSGGNRHRKRRFHSAETTTTRLSADSTTTSISRVGGRRRPTGSGRALAAPRPQSFAVPPPLRNKEVDERRSQLKRHRHQTPSTNDATQSSSIKEILVGDAPAPIAIDIRSSEEGSQ